MTAQMLGEGKVKGVKLQVRLLYVITFVVSAQAVSDALQCTVFNINVC